MENTNLELPMESFNRGYFSRYQKITLSNLLKYLQDTGNMGSVDVDTLYESIKGFSVNYVIANYDESDDIRLETEKKMKAVIRQMEYELQSIGNPFEAGRILRNTPVSVLAQEGEKQFDRIGTEIMNSMKMVSAFFAPYKSCNSLIMEIIRLTSRAMNQDFSSTGNFHCGFYTLINLDEINYHFLSGKCLSDYSFSSNKNNEIDIYSLQKAVEDLKLESAILSHFPTDKVKKYLKHTNEEQSIIGCVLLQYVLEQTGGRKISDNSLISYERVKRGIEDGDLTFSGELQDYISKNFYPYFEK